MSTPVSESPDLPRDERMLALAGLMQALQQVRRIADTGHADGAILEPARHGVGLALTARLENAFDEDYDSIVGFPGRGRTLYAGGRVHR
jgi:hypothetical protein